MNFELVWWMTGELAPTKVSHVRLTDGEERPGNSGRSSSVAFSAGKGVRGRRGLKENERQEHEDLGPDSSLVGVGVDAESLEEGEHNEDNGPWCQLCQGE